MPVKNGNRRSGGTAPKPSRTLTKKFQYQEFIACNNSTSEYAYFSKYMKPDITKATGSLVQFNAYELWRLKKIKASIQIRPEQSTASQLNNLNAVASALVWTAPDYGANETVSGASLLQYQNAKRNTVSLNKWTNIVNTDCKINSNLSLGGSAGNFALPSSTWINTTNYRSDFYSGYQMFIQLPGFQSFTVGAFPGFTLVTELHVEFLQPAFQNSVSTFSTRVFDCKVQVIPDPALPNDYRTYVFDTLTFDRNANGKREYQVRLVREDGQPGSITYTNAEFLDVYNNGTSGQYFGNRKVIYDGPIPSEFRLD